MRGPTLDVGRLDVGVRRLDGFVIDIESFDCLGKRCRVVPVFGLETLFPHLPRRAGLTSNLLARQATPLVSFIAQFTWDRCASLVSVAKPRNLNWDGHFLNKTGAN
jgi:hypothetical protein